MIRVEGLRFAYPGSGARLAVGDLELRKGELWGVFGPNGAGKSTLLRLVAGNLTPKQGRIEIDGRGVDEWSRRELARLLAVVPQGVRFAFGYTVLETVLMGRAPHRSPFSLEDEKDLAAARHAMEAMELSAFEGRTIDTLSGGEAKRVLVARALAQEAPILLLDEPTSSLDLKHRLACYSLFRRLAEEENRCVLLISHDLHLAAPFCSRVALMKEGGVEAAGPADEVLTEERLSHVFEVPVRCVREDGRLHIQYPPE